MNELCSSADYAHYMQSPANKKQILYRVKCMKGKKKASKIR